MRLFASLLVPMFVFIVAADTAFALRPQDVSIEQAKTTEMVKRSENRAKARKKDVQGENAETTLSSDFKSQRYRAMVRSQKGLVRNAVSSARERVTTLTQRRSSSSSSKSNSSSSRRSSVSSVSSSSKSSSSVSYIGSSLAQEVLALVNQERAKANLKPLALNPYLNDSAQDYAELMSQKDFFSHEDPNGNRSYDRILEAGYLAPPCDCDWQYYTGENLGKNQASAKEVVQAWMDSASHRANVLRAQYTDMGLGYANGYWVQHFGARVVY